jgi:hypothetical protein
MQADFDYSRQRLKITIYLTAYPHLLELLLAAPHSSVQRRRMQHAADPLGV